MPSKKIDKIVNSVNLVEDLSDEEKLKIVDDCINRFMDDKQSQTEWMAEAEESLKLAALKSGPKNTPFPHASNVTYPLITTAITQFAARTMPEIVRGNRLVEMAVIGQDPDGSRTLRAKRAAEYMTYQLLFQSNDWHESTDRLLQLYSNIGQVFRKVHFDPLQKKLVFQLCRHDEVYVNNEVTTIEQARAITHIYMMPLNDIISYQRSGIFSKIEVKKHDCGSVVLESADKDLHEILEQHCYYDLDDDGYEEPYIVTIHNKTQQLLRMVPRFFSSDVEYNKKNEIVRIRPINMFIDYNFIQSLDGTYRGLGFGTLLRSMNHAANSIINQLIDAGKLASMQGGIIDKRLRIKSGTMLVNPGEWKIAESVGPNKLRDGIHPFDYKEPSGTLFSLLQMIIESSKEVASLTDTLQGRNTKHNEKATSTLEYVNQGLTLHTSIVKRLFMSLKKEFELVYRYNSVFVSPEEYANIMNVPIEDIMGEDGTVIDFNIPDFDIAPVADPNMSSDSKRTAQNQVLLQFLGRPEIDNAALIRRVLESIDVPQIDTIVPPPSNEPTQADKLFELEVADKQGKLELRDRELDIREKQLEIAAIESKTKSIKNLADAEAAEVGQQLATYKSELEALKFQFDIMREETRKNEQATVEGMEGAPSDASAEEGA